MRIAEVVSATAATAAAALASGTAFGQVTTLTQAGYTGLEITPNAHLIDWGRTEATYDSQLPGVVRNPAGRNYVLGFGLLPNVEIAGRLATNSLHANCFTDGCGVRDLSASAKVGISFDAAHHYSIAAGVTDLGGTAANFRTYYGVLTFDQGPLQASAGVARRRISNPSISIAPLHGPFAAVAWQPAPWLRGQVEYTDGHAWAGVSLFAPTTWLPKGWRAFVGANRRLTSTNLTRSAWVSAGISIPLYKVPSLRDDRAVSTTQSALGSPPLSNQNGPELASGSATSAPAAPESAARAMSSGASRRIEEVDLEHLADALELKGLEDIFVGRMPDGSVAVRANNGSYTWNSVDALGAALGAVARVLAETKAAYRLVLTQRQVPIVAVTGQSHCLREWINNPNAACTAGQLSTPGGGALDAFLSGATWQVTNRNPAWHTVHVLISPALHTNIGTELGAFDYSAGANVGLRLPVWRGASVEWRRDVPLANSTNYAANGAFGAKRIRSETERLALTQTLRLPLERWIAPVNDVTAFRWGLTAVTAQVTVGRVGAGLDGADGQLRWEPGEGRHRLSADVGYFPSASLSHAGAGAGTRHAKPVMVRYRYNVTATRTFLEAAGGQFLYNDRGFQLGIRQWFSDVSIGAYYRRSRFQGSPVRQFVGLELSIPIGPRREVALGSHVQVRGTARFSHSVETLVRSGSNAVRPGFGIASPAPSLDQEFNADRTGLVYFEDSMPRIREAAR